MEELEATQAHLGREPPFTMTAQERRRACLPAAKPNS